MRTMQQMMAMPVPHGTLRPPMRPFAGLPPQKLQG